MEKNDAGQVAIRYYQPKPHTLKLGNGKDYYFDVRGATSLAWVDEVHVGMVLDVVKVCCGGNKKKVYHLADATDVSRWTSNNPR